ncbi:DUF3237 domain-containing protein [Geodermatophilus sp. YIM 151500]|uniref:DUF3237 domain-containing protein n=1 Tax=Geodermatophilus sp. YIM 151500 TaxID=2984531 RepID=UPI0021E45606|nr:DUF3237 domain-containing protein [Geodermatophilus sp. YIM 151500]MCV2490796.1 DUF3237 domain-containing protein [Geodermatophilus sp. YIM 151500]
MSDRSTRARIFRMEGRLTELVVVGLLPEGVRMHNTFEGTIVDGEPAGGHVRGIDEFVIRPDGVGAIDAREVLSATAGTAYADVLGYAHPPAGMPPPPLEVFLDPAFRWPDARFAIECGATYRSAAPGLGELARTAVVHLGWVNMATRELVIEGYRASALRPDSRSAAAAAA